MGEILEKPARKRGRPATGKDPLVPPFRMPGTLRSRVEEWGESQGMSRSAAFRFLIDFSLRIFEQARRGEKP